MEWFYLSKTPRHNKSILECGFGPNPREFFTIIHPLVSFLWSCRHLSTYGKFCGVWRCCRGSRACWSRRSIFLALEKRSVFNPKKHTFWCQVTFQHHLSIPLAAEHHYSFTYKETCKWKFQRTHTFLKPIQKLWKRYFFQKLQDLIF